MRRFKPLVEGVGLVGFIVLIAARADWLPSSTPTSVLVAASVAMLFGGSLLVVADVWAWVRTGEWRKAIRPKHGCRRVVGRALAGFALVLLALWLALGFFAGWERQSADWRMATVVVAAVALLIASLLVRDIVLGRATKGEPLE